MHAIRVDYVQFMYNDAVAQLTWKTPNQSETKIPTKYLYTCPPADCFVNPEDANYFESKCNEPETEELTGTPFSKNCREGNGLTAEYFSDSKLRKSKLKTIETSINFRFNHQNPKPNIHGDEFSIRYTGGLLTEETGEYTFYFTVDDGARIWIDDKLVLNEWDLHEETQFQFTANTEANRMHKVRIEYVQFMYEDAVAKFEWKTPSGIRSVVPMRNLYPVENVNCNEEIAKMANPEKFPKKNKSKLIKGVIAGILLVILTSLQLSKGKGNGER